MSVILRSSRRPALRRLRAMRSVRVIRGVGAIRRLGREARGMTLIELLMAMTIGMLVLGVLYVLVEASARSQRIVNAVVAETEQGREALTWVADRLRQASYDPEAACPEGLILIGSGNGFEQRLAFRSVIDEEAERRRVIYAFYVQDGVLWQETRPEPPEEPCDAEATRSVPDPRRTALTRPIVRALDLRFFDAQDRPARLPRDVRSVAITLRLAAAATPGVTEAQTFQTSVTLRGP